MELELLRLRELCPKVKLNNFFSDVALEGKTVLVLGGHGIFEVTLRCLIERQGMEAVVSHWTSKNLKSEVGCLI